MNKTKKAENNPSSRRLIEDYLPIEAISKEASREKSVRKGHISTLHLWWARRPLVACRAAVYGVMVDAPTTDEEREEKSKFVEKLCTYPGSKDIIAQAERHVLEAHAKRLSEETGKGVTAEDIYEGRAPRPKVLDMFAGGGAIPLEALRLGCDAYALDLNPVAHIIELCTLVYPQKYGKPNPNERGMTGPKNDKGETTWGGLAQEVEYWGKWVLHEVEKEIRDLYPPIPDPEVNSNQTDSIAYLPGIDSNDTHSTPNEYLTTVAYLWTRTVICKNPSCSATVPLVRQTWLCKKTAGKNSPGRYVALQIIAPKGEKRVRFKVVESETEKGLGFDPAGFSKGGNASCPFCGTVADSQYVKSEGQAGRLNNHQMMAFVCTRTGQKGKIYLSADELQQFIPNNEEIQKRTDHLCAEMNISVPSELLVEKLTDQLPNYGIRTFQDLFTPRQLFSLMSFSKTIRSARSKLETLKNSDEKAKVILTYLAVILNKLADFSSSFCLFNYTGGRGVKNTFGRQAIQMTWDFAETNPFNPDGASWVSGIEDVPISIKKNNDNRSFAHVFRGSATSLVFEDAKFEAVITDPPYYDNIQYSSLSDYFYVWMKQSIGDIYPDHFSTRLTPKKKEAVASVWRQGKKDKSYQAYEKMMFESFTEAYRVLKKNGYIAVVYAHKTTLGWSSLIDALRNSGFIVVEAWPLDTEKKGRVLAQNTSALASSIFIIACKRKEEIIGSYENEVRKEITEIVKERVNTLWEMGITGADLVISCVGAGLRAFTKFSRVEYANGEEVPAEKMLADVESAVLETLMNKIFIEQSDKEDQSLADISLGSVDGPTRFYILWRYTYRAAEMEAGEAIVFTYGQNVELDGPDGLSSGNDALIEKKKNKYSLLDYSQRGDNDKLGLPGRNNETPPLIDVLHRILWLIEHEPRNLSEFLEEANPNTESLRLVANILSGTALEGKSLDQEKLITTTASESAALKKLLANWNSLIEGHAPKGPGPLFK